MKKSTYPKLHLELAAVILYTGRGHQYCVLVKYEVQTPSIRRFRARKPEILIPKTPQNMEPFPTVRGAKGGKIWQDSSGPVKFGRFCHT